jgi:hypothetical protein
MNVILAIVININNCYFGYLEQLENKMHLNVPKYNNNNNNDIISKHNFIMSGITTMPRATSL